ncbi:uncharacterized protein LOC133084242 isoform X3 [Eubalaena glacialis]|uniref:uncharacterized protein LOC133084242 isoform X3 n=1 Tax=Eubalaena glacialis TaxID=27606 RepID=UPI002A5AEF0E|nr:uncharacterized protein LOC133084242 isoform X3 [Eubalaena glacialis]
MLETDTEGVTTCGVTSAEESRGEGLPEDHGRARALPAPCLQPCARTHLGAELVHRLPELMEVEGQPQQLLGDAQPPAHDHLHGEGLIEQHGVGTRAEPQQAGLLSLQPHQLPEDRAVLLEPRDGQRWGPWATPSPRAPDQVLLEPERA